MSRFREVISGGQLNGVSPPHGQPKSDMLAGQTLEVQRLRAQAASLASQCQQLAEAQHGTAAANLALVDECTLLRRSNAALRDENTELRVELATLKGQRQAA